MTSPSKPYRDTRLPISDICAHCGEKMPKGELERVTVRTNWGRYITVHFACVFKAMEGK